MTDDEKAAFIAKIKRVEAAANARGETIDWYEIRPDGSGVSFRYRALPPKRRTSATPPPPSPDGRRRSAGRGALVRASTGQGSLL